MTYSRTDETASRQNQVAKKHAKHGAEQRQTNSKEKRDTARQEKHSRRIAPNNGSGQAVKRRETRKQKGEHEKIHKDIAEQ